MPIWVSNPATTMRTARADNWSGNQVPDGLAARPIVLGGELMILITGDVVEGSRDSNFVPPIECRDIQ